MLISRLFFGRSGRILLLVVGLLSGPAAIASTYEYDALGRLTIVTFPDGSQVLYSYDDAGNRTEKLSSATTVNNAPGAVQDDVSVDQALSIVISPLTNDTDPNSGDVLSLAGVTDGRNGAVTDNLDGTVTYSADPGFAGLDQFTYSVEDTDGAADTGLIVVTVNNLDPVAVADIGIATECNSGAECVFPVIDVLPNDSDPGGDVIVISDVDDPPNGGVTFTKTELTYYPDFDFQGVDTFNYTVSDDEGGSASASIAVTVASTNQSPVANSDSLAIPKGGSGSIQPMANDTDADTNDVLSISQVSNGAHGATAVLPGDYVQFIPGANVLGRDTFTYTVSDAEASTVGTVTVDVYDTNVMVRNSSGTYFNGYYLDETCPPSEPCETYVRDSGGNAVYTYVSGLWNPRYYEQASTAVYYDPSASTVNVAPDAVSDSETIDEDTSGVFAVLGNDSDPESGALSVVATGQGANGSVTFNASSVTYTPTAGWNGADSFTYTIEDNKGATDTATVNVTVSSVNDAPIAIDDAHGTNEDSGITMDPRGNDSDPEGDPLTITAVTQSANGTVSFTGSDVTYTPTADWNGIEAFTYTVSDGNGGTDAGTVTMTVSAVNDAPVATTDTEATIADVAMTFDPRINDTDVEGDTLTITAATNGANGTTGFSATSMTYTPDAGWTGSDTITYTVSDGNGGTDTGTVNVTVSAAPGISVANGSASEGDNITFAVSMSPSSAVSHSVSYALNDGTALAAGDYTDASGTLTFAAGETSKTVVVATTEDTTYEPTETFSHLSSATGGAVITDAQAIGTINDDDVANNPPVAVNNSYSVYTGGLSYFYVLNNDSDPDSDPLTITSFTQGTKGIVSIQSAGTRLRYLAGSSSGSDNFTYTISDGNGGTDTASVSVSITSNGGGGGGGGGDEN